jgi:short-subunit dehydrogenase
MARHSIRGTRTLVTGASSGIGQALALELARQGGDVLLNARRRDRLSELSSEIERLGQRVIVVDGDITDPAVRSACLDAAKEHLGGIDMLVNNAGIGAIGPFLEASPDRLRRIMEVNFFAPAELIRLSAPVLRGEDRPLIINISSVLGHRAVPNKSEYCASKFALHGLSDALRAELRRDGIDLLIVSPSTTASEFFDNVISAALPRLQSGGMDPSVVARKTVHAIRRGRHEIILSPGGKLLVWLDRLCPPLMNRLIAKWGDRSPT